MRYKKVQYDYPSNKVEICNTEKRLSVVLIRYCLTYKVWITYSLLNMSLTDYEDDTIMIPSNIDDYEMLSEKSKQNLFINISKFFSMCETKLSNRR